ncbi:hypothetical protein Sros_8272 [Streptosporangium roseum DSM 43021]|uniref:Uncharacterized protein n=1 Tax=Streptosporangium roseum (strain ATCC 12428 / DSM 43021 / JCM 3005 / KCTC 9067 / NCIMB 10171 / NRRL 2505 / NI 9100) TaxID=479432 RepID=D2AYY3_STRRD|nr:hypothetical protein Sros_8272 [Streptosporangium roseum DSM 43021]
MIGRSEVAGERNTLTRFDEPSRSHEPARPLGPPSEDS